MATENSSMAGVAGRYASALFELAHEAGQLPDVERGMDQFRQLLDASPDLRRVVRSPVFSADEQARAVKAVLDKVGIGGLTVNFLQLVARNRRLFAVADMIEAFRAILARHRGEVSADVASAVPLTPAQLHAVQETLKTSIGKNVRVHTRVDAALLGGLVVKVGSRMLDSSLRTKLSAMKTRMKGIS